MKSLFLLTMMVAMTTKITGQLSCNTCTWTSGSTTDSECFSGVGITFQPSCPYAPDQNPYCQAQMTMRDGILVNITRGCAAGIGDFDQSTVSIPSRDKCVTMIDTIGSDVEHSECYFSCNTSNCNDVKSESLKLCSVNCGIYGSCDYITGTCACSVGFSGESCNVGSPPALETFMSCVQCDQETDPTCQDMTSGTPCSSTSHKYCSTTMVTTFDEKGVKVRSSVTKACSASYVASDECFISKRSDSYSTDVEYTCVTTCDVNNCNTKIPDGLITGNEVKQPIRCIQCSSSDVTSACSAGDVEATEVCPSSATHCKSVASYYFSERSDATYQVEPDYQMISIVRSCSNSSVTRDCSSVTLDGSSLNVVTCQETCDTDSCNDGWPARPKCSQCNGEVCTSSPPQPTQCPLPYQRYCTLQEINKQIDSSENSALFGYSRISTRGCSYHGIGTKCDTNSYGDGKSENCNKTCETDGCNLGSITKTPYQTTSPNPDTTLLSTTSIKTSAVPEPITTSTGSTSQPTITKTSGLKETTTTDTGAQNRPTITMMAVMLLLLFVHQ